MAEYGRPKSKNPRVNRIGVRLTPGEKDKLEEYASSHNMTITDVILYAVNLLYDNEQKVSKTLS